MDDAELDRSVLEMLAAAYNDAKSQLTSQKSISILDELNAHIVNDFSYEVLLRQMPRQRRPIVHLEDRVSARKGSINLKDIGSIDYSLYQNFVIQSAVKDKEMLVSVFIPTKGNGHRIYENVSALTQDLQKMPEGIGFEIIFCLNNPNDNSAAEVLRFLEERPYIAARILEIKSNFSIADKKIPTNISYYLVMEQQHSLRSVNPDLKHYLHFHDDDIIITQLGDTSGVFINLNELGQYDALKLTSGIYSTSVDRKGFGFLNSAAKNTSLFKKVRQPPVQIYGGAATMPLEHFPREGIPAGVKGFDAFMSTYLLLDHLPSNTGGFSVFDLPSRSNPNLFVEHPEEQSIYRFITRLVRDYEYKSAVIEHYHHKNIELFYQLRKERFEAVKSIIIGLQDDEPLKIGFLFYDSFRKKVKEKYEQGRFELNLLRRMQPDIDSNADIKLEYLKRVNDSWQKKIN